ncbi:MAG: hypothetical protein ACRDX9_04345 [Acidimicrobiia bacterium]
MADRDAAFLWETEALRGSPPTPAAHPHEERTARSDWLTLREASTATGIPVTTLRNWARKGRVATSLDETADGTRRMVSLDEVKARARQLGQDIEPLTTSETVPPPRAEADPGSPPPGTMLVPIDAWDKMLLQLGNLHQAGQQLADARERAAKAETEAAFLRERLAEMRATQPSPPSEPAPSPTPIGDEDPEPAPEAPGREKMPRFTAYLWRMAVSDRRRK